MSEKPTTAVAKKESLEVSFVPFGASDAIKLTVSMIQTMIAIPTKTGKQPSYNDCVKFMALCQARKLNPFEGDAYLIGYDTRDQGPKFNLITSIQAFLKRAEASPSYDGMESGIIIERDGKIEKIEGDFYLKGDKVLGGWATVHRKAQQYPIKKSIRLERFQKAYGVWSEDAAGMICKCAEADALRTSFPTMLGGMYLPQELEGDTPKTTAPVFTAPEGKEEKKAKPEPEPVEPDEPTVKDIEELCKRDGIKETDLIEFAQSIALCDDDCDTVHSLPAEAINSLFNQWAEFSEKIKEVCK